MLGRKMTVVGALLVPLIASVAVAAPQQERGCSGLARGESTVNVRWAAPQSTAGCFFFSGPGSLGRNDSLGSTAALSWQGERMVLAFGRARFEGNERGGTVRLARRTTHAYSGNWRVTELIEGSLASTRRGDSTCTVLNASYRYQECGPGGPCPGQCTIAASMVVSAR